MQPYDRRNRRELDQLVEEYITTNNINRRQFIQRATALGLSLSGASALLAACGGGPPGGGAGTKVTSIDSLVVISGTELANYQAVNAAFTKKYGIKVNVESTRDLPTVLTTRVRGNNPPDISAVPDLNTLQRYAAQGKVVQLDTFLDMSYIHQNYAQTWINLVSYNGHMYAVPFLANSKGTIWYNPKQFQANGYTIPTTWNDMITLSNKIAASGKYPWSIGVESGAASGWPAADWVDQIFLCLNGPTLSDQWVAHKIPWTHPAVKNAFQMFGQIAHGNHYVNGGTQYILSTNFMDASYLPYDTPPRAYMFYLGDFTEGFITAQFPNLVAGVDFNFFPFPTINPQYAGAVTGGADLYMAMKDNDGTRKYMQFLTTAEAQEIWTMRGGKTAVNKSVPLSAYPNQVAQNTAKQLTQASIFRESQDDSMPTAMENAYWHAMLSYIQNPSQLDSILSSLESTASTAYTS